MALNDIGMPFGGMIVIGNLVDGTLSYGRITNIPNLYNGNTF